VPFVEILRYSYLEAGTFDLMQPLFSFGFRVVIFNLEAMIFKRVGATFMDTV